MIDNEYAYIAMHQEILYGQQRKENEIPLVDCSKNSYLNALGFNH